MNTIRTVTQEEMKNKFANFAKSVLGTSLNESHVAIVSDRTPSKISVIEHTDFLSVLKEKGFSIPKDMEDIAVVSVINTTKRSTTGKKMKR